MCPTHTDAVADGDIGECPFKEGSAAGGGDLLSFLPTLTLSLVSEKQNSQNSVGMSPMRVKPTIADHLILWGAIIVVFFTVVQYHGVHNVLFVLLMNSLMLRGGGEK